MRRRQSRVVFWVLRRGVSVRTDVRVVYFRRLRAGFCPPVVSPVRFANAGGCEFVLLPASYANHTVDFEPWLSLMDQ